MMAMMMMPMMMMVVMVMLVMVILLSLPESTKPMKLPTVRPTV